MTVTHWQPDGRLIAGVIVLEDLEEQGQFAVRDAVAAEISPFLPTDFNILVSVCSWGLSVKVTDFIVAAIKTISGFPLCGKFGRITYNSLSTFREAYFLQHEFQQYAPQRCLCYPIGYIDLPYSNADIVVVGEIASIATATAVFAGGENIIYGYDTYTGCTGFHYDFAATVTANCAIPYVVKSYDDNPAAQSGVFTQLNY